MKTKSLAILAFGALLAASAPASQVTLADPAAGGVGYRYTVQMGGLDTATFSNHVGAWSWEDNSLFNAETGESPVGWTHTSNWVAVHLSTTSVFKVRLERDATVPWPSAGDPARLASVASMFPSFTIWTGWDNDLAPQAFADVNNEGTPLHDWHTYNNHGAVEWAEDLTYQDHANNTTETFVERTYILPAGDYTLVLGSNAPANDTNRQGYKATFTTTQELPIIITNDTYFTRNPVKVLTVAADKGVLVNDLGVATPGDVLQLVTPPKNGTVTLNADGSFTYTPGQYFGVAGYDSFTYRLLVDGDANTPTSLGAVTVSTFAAAAGIYAGHIKDEDSGEIAGIVKMKVTSDGLFTSVVQHLGKKYALAGKVSDLGEMTPRSTSGLGIELHLSTHADGDRHAHVHVHGVDAHFEAHVPKSPFSSTNPPPAVGRHKVALTFDTGDEGGSTKNGTGILIVSKNGSASLVGALGDKTAFSTGTALVPATGTGPALPIYAAVYRKPGSLSGTLTFGVDATSFAAGELKAVKPPVGSNPGFTVTYDATTAPIVTKRLKRD